MRGIHCWRAVWCSQVSSQFLCQNRLVYVLVQGLQAIVKMNFATDGLSQEWLHHLVQSTHQFWRVHHMNFIERHWVELLQAKNVLVELNLTLMSFGS